MKVLVVDKQETISLLERLQRKNPKFVITAVSEGDHLKSIMEGEVPPKVAFLNCSLLDRDGMDLCNSVKELEGEYTHIVLLTDDSVEQLLKSIIPEEKEFGGILGREALTKKQQEVLQLLSNGCSNKEIADTLRISVGTVKSHMTHILGKIGAANRTQAITKAAQLGLISLKF